MKKIKKIALVAHDNRKKDLLEWVDHNKDILKDHKIICTGTTGKLVSKILKNSDIKILKSGPLGGDQQLGSMIVDKSVDILIFFWDAMTSQPHDVDVKALLRITVLYNIPTACNRSTADFLITSELFENEYKPMVKDYYDYKNREIV